MNPTQANAPLPRHILALNDSQEVLNVIRQILEEEGYRVTVGSRLAPLISQIQALAPDLIILDYMWAQEDTGWSSLQLLKLDRTTAAIPVILCTGASREVAGISAQLADMNVRVVLKPFDIDTLIAAVADVLAGGSAP